MLVLSIAAFVYAAIVFLKDDLFLLDDIIAIAVFVLNAVFFCVYATLLDKRRKKLIDKYYGAISEEDKRRAISLLKDIDTLEEYIYACLDDGRLQGYEDAAARHLRDIKKGLKLHRKDFDALKADLESARAKTNKRIDDKYINYTNEMFELFAANLYDL